jgi:hypothetical protein
MLDHHPIKFNRDLGLSMIFSEIGFHVGSRSDAGCFGIMLWLTADIGD